MKTKEITVKISLALDEDADIMQEVANRNLTPIMDVKHIPTSVLLDECKERNEYSEYSDSALKQEIRDRGFFFELSKFCDEEIEAEFLDRFLQYPTDKILDSLSEEDIIEYVEDDLRYKVSKDSEMATANNIERIIQVFEESTKPKIGSTDYFILEELRDYLRFTVN